MARNVKNRRSLMNHVLDCRRRGWRDFQIYSWSIFLKLLLDEVKLLLPTNFCLFFHRFLALRVLPVERVSEEESNVGSIWSRKNPSILAFFSFSSDFAPNLLSYRVNVDHELGL